MRNLWLVAKHEYSRMVHRRSFLLASLGIPLLIVAVMGISIFFAMSGEQPALGYVDQANLLDTAAANAEEDVVLRAFSDVAAAQQALEAGDVGAYYVVPPGYPRETRTVELYYRDEQPAGETADAFSALLREALTRDLDPAVREQVLEAPQFTTRTPDGGREFGAAGVVNVLLPFVVAFFFFFAVIAAAGYLLQVVADEKENRTIEIMVTSMTPEQLIGGKALGLLGVSLTQLLIWLAAGVVGVIVGSRFFAPLQAFDVPWAYLLLVALFFVPSFALLAGIMTAIGGAVTEVRQGQQIAGILNMLFILPFFFIGLVFANPNSAIILFLTFFPTTSFMTVVLRWGIGSIPTWQIALSWIILVTSAVLAVWASARIFRAGMLRYGQRLSVKGMLAAVGIGA